MGSNNPFQRASPIPAPPRHPTPHVRLNSGVHNILTDFSSPDTTTNTTSTSRSLTQNTTYQSTNSGTGVSHSGNGLFANTPTAAESAELLLPPQKTRSRPRYRDVESPVASPVASPLSNASRRSSWSSESESVRHGGPFASPFDDSRAPSPTGSTDELINTQTVSEKYNIQPGDGLLLFPEDVEKDDYLHNPDPRDKEARCDPCSTRGVMNVGALMIMTIGVLALIIGYPVAYVFAMALVVSAG